MIFRTHILSAALAALMTFGVCATAMADDTSALARGEVFVGTEPVKGSDTARLVVRAVIDAPPEKVWKIVTDCDRFEERMPNIEAAKEIKRKGNKSWCDVEVDLPFPLSNLRAVSVATNVPGPKVWRRQWKLVRGDYDFNTGSWVLKRFGKSKKRTLAVYRVHAKPKMAVPDWVRERAQKSSMPDLIERIREEVKKL